MHALALLGQLYLDSGEPEKAVELGKRAYELRPDEGPVVLLHLSGKANLAIGRPLSALKAFKELIRLAPSQPAGYLGAAETYEVLGSSFDAAELYAKAAEVEPQKSTCLKQAQLELKLGRTARALAAVGTLLKEEPDEPVANALAAQSLEEMGMSDESTRFWMKARSRMEEWRVEQKHGSSLAMMGRFEEAEKHSMKSIMLQPIQGNAYHMIFSNRRAEDGDLVMLGRMRELLLGQELPQSDQAPMAFALGKAYDDLGDCEEAFHFYDIGHDFQRQMLKQPFDKTCLAEQFEAQKKLFHQPPEATMSDGAEPIFVVGMLRSGTTLTEQILSMHSQVAGAGEVDFWTGSEPLMIDRSIPLFMEEVAHERKRAYRRILDSFGGGSRRVVDKFPGNLNLVGMLHHLYPNAHFISLRRNPLDIAVSIWATYSNPCSPFTTTKATVAAAIKHAIAQAEYWREIVPADRFLQVCYEDLVSRPEEVVKRILTFCGLRFESCCLRFSEGKSKIRTPSLWQVRQPIYKSSVNRWRRYEPYLGDFSDLMVPVLNVD